MLGLSDLKILVKKAFDRGFIDSHVLGFDDFEQDLKRGIECPGEPWRPDDHEYTLFGDTVDELSGWYCFTEHTMRTRSGGGNGPTLIQSSASPTKIRSRCWAKRPMSLRQREEVQ